MRKAFIVVASADHVRRGQAGGFVQACHGEAGPLRRLIPEDGVLCYSPRLAFRGADPCRAFTAAGVVAAGEPYQVVMSQAFRPWRRDMVWAPTIDVPIAPLLDRLAFTAGRSNWGAALRFGFVEIPPEDFALVAEAMRAG